MPSFTPGSILSEPREFYNLLTFLILRAVAGVESLLQCEGVFQPGFLSSPSSHVAPGRNARDVGENHTNISSKCSAWQGQQQGTSPIDGSAPTLPSKRQQSP